MEINSVDGFQVGLNNREICDAVIHYLVAMGYRPVADVVRRCELDSIDYSVVEGSLFLLFTRSSLRPGMNPDDDS